VSAYDQLQKKLRARPATWLVTGCAGFIGSHLIEKLLSLGQKVVGLDNFATGNNRNLREVERLVGSKGWKNFRFFRGDIRTLQTCRRATEGVDYVLHQAALGSVPRSVEDPVTSNRANITATLNVLVAAREAGVKRLVYAGSSSAYGDTPTLPKREDMPTNPMSPYALQKLVGERYCQLFTQLYKFPAVTIRYFNVFGPRQDPGSPYSGVISRFTAALLEGERPVIHGDGEQTRDFTYVANVVDGVLRACEAPDASGEVINVATGGRISLNDLLRVLNRLNGSNMQPIYKEARAGDVRDSQADISKARNLLGYQPAVFLEEGLERTLRWCQTSFVGAAGHDKELKIA